MIKMKELLREFAHLVNTNAYEKVPYTMWRDLKKHAEEPVDVYGVIGWDNSDSGCEITLTALDSHKEFGFYEDDYSFGSFLYDQLRDGTFDKTCQGVMGSWSGAKLKFDDMSIISDVQPMTISSALDNITLKLNLDKCKENNDMDNKLFKNFDFGVCSNDNIKASFYGLAVKNATGTWVSYDTKTDSVIDVDIINFDGGKYFYKIPVAIKDVKAGDVVIHNRKPVFVKAVEDNRVIAVDPAAGEEKAVLLTRSPFNFDFVTKVVSLLDNLMGEASVDNPFGNILPFILLNDTKGSSNDLLPLLFLNGGLNDFSQNPMLLYFLLGNQANDKDSFLPLLFLNGGNFGANKDNASKK